MEAAQTMGAKVVVSALKLLVLLSLVWWRSCVNPISSCFPLPSTGALDSGQVSKVKSPSHHRHHEQVK